MKFTEEMVRTIHSAPYITLITLDANGNPHPIIVGGKTITENSIEIGIYKMEVTQDNLKTNGKTWVLASTADNQKPKGYRFTGTSIVDKKSVIFIPDSAENLL